SVLPTFAQDSNPILPAPLLNTNISYYHQSQTTVTSGIIPASDTVVLMGQVIDLETEEALPFANVIVVGTSIGISTDFDGNFLLKVPKSKEAITLEVHYVGFPTLSYSIVPDSTKTGLTLKMDGQHLILGNMIGGIMLSKKAQRANKRAYKKELREVRKRERAALKEQKS
ncbi:MAG: carboxypeptidase-like regulatory domain-containing protein, partial [Aureispira sp.]|nr:carboxypeptidase-like regulatory domain-containing protein [Aureispira sp.]